jgi:hypothetical protein
MPYPNAPAYASVVSLNALKSTIVAALFNTSPFKQPLQMEGRADLSCTPSSSCE